MLFHQTNLCSCPEFVGKLVELFVEATGVVDE